MHEKPVARTLVYMKDIQYYKKALEDERDKLANELNRLGTKSPSTPNDWDVKAPDIDVMTADENELADRTEEIHIDSIVLDELEARHRNIQHALEKMGKDSFGTCEVCDAQIEADRLDANPAARTCKKHMGEENKLNL